MKKLICFGDSNTFGFNPNDCSRYGSDVRWTGVLAKLLGENYSVIEEGCNDRTAFFENPNGILQTGPVYISECLNKNPDFEIFILALGTNDLQFLYKLDKKIVEDGLKKLINIIRNFNKKARIIIVPPVLLSEYASNGTFHYQFDESSIEKSIWIQKIYKKVASLENCEILDFNEIVKPSHIDGLHFSPESHSIMAENVATIISKNSEKLVNIL